MWIVCDLTMHIILSKLKIVDLREYPLEQIQIPSMYFTPQAEGFDNKHDYLSKDFRNLDQPNVEPEAKPQTAPAQVKRDAAPVTKPASKKARTS